MFSRILYCSVAVYLTVGSHVADYSATHLFNPGWPPHAKFHTGQTLMFSIFLAVLTWYFALRKTKDKTPQVTVAPALRADQSAASGVQEHLRTDTQTVGRALVSTVE